MTDSRLRDVVFMLIALELTVLGAIEADGSWTPIVLLAIAITAVVFFKELARTFTESPDSPQ